MAKKITKHTEIVDGSGTSQISNVSPHKGSIQCVFYILVLLPSHLLLVPLRRLMNVSFNIVWLSVLYNFYL